MLPEEHIIIRERLRKRPGMYLGSVSSNGLGILICEVIGNPLDLFLRHQASTITIQLDELGLTVEDDGPGFPFETTGSDGITPFVEYHCTRYHNAPSADGHAPHVHMNNLNGVGLAVVAAACQELHIQSRRQGQLWEQRFIQGESVAPAKVIGRAEGSGSFVHVLFDQVLFNHSKPRIDIIRQKCLETVYLLPGLTIHFREERFYSASGLVDLAKLFHPASKAIEPFLCNIMCGAVEIQAVAIGKIRRGQAFCKAWVNGCHSLEEGTHVDAFRAALKRIKYQPQAIYIHVIMHDPEFAGPTNTRLDMPQVKLAIESCLFEALDKWRSALSERPNRHPNGFG
jgi:DNA gyrase subunit B